MKKLFRRCIGFVVFDAISSSLLLMAVWVAGNSFAYASQVAECFFFAILLIAVQILAAYIAFNW